MKASKPDKNDCKMSEILKNEKRGAAMTIKEYKFKLDDHGLSGFFDLLKTLVEESFPEMPHKEMSCTAAQRVMRNLREHYGPEQEVTFIAKERFGRVSYTYKIIGEEYDPRLIAQTENEQDHFVAALLEKYSGCPLLYKYSNGINTISIVYKKKKTVNPVLKIVIGLLLGVLLSLVGLAFSQSLQENLTVILDTMNGICLNLIVMSATLVVFFMVVNSISGFGSIETVKKSGSCLLKNYLLHYLLSMVLVALYIIFAFNFTVSTGSGNTGLLSILAETIAGIFPGSYVTPFADCSFLQIVFLGVVVGIAILILGDRVQPVADFFNAAEMVSSQIMEWFCGLIPLYIFSMVPALVWGGQLAEISGMLIHLIGIVVLMFLDCAVFFLWMCHKRKVSLKTAFKAVSPALLQGTLTASSTSTLGQIQDGIRSLNVRESFNGFASAAGMIFVKMSAFIRLFVTTFVLIMAANVDVTVSLLVGLTISSLLFSVATPPVSGGILAIAIILATMFGVPDSYMAILAPMMLIEDFIGTGLRCENIIVHSVLAAAQMDEIE